MNGTPLQCYLAGTSCSSLALDLLGQECIVYILLNYLYFVFFLEIKLLLETITAQFFYVYLMHHQHLYAFT